MECGSRGNEDYGAYVKKTIDGSAYSTDDLDGYMREGFTFSASTDFITISGTSETPVFLLKNVGSTRLIQLYSLAFGADSNSSRAIFKFYAQPTITSNGTTVTVRNNYIGHTQGTVAETYHSPTISANGTFVTALLLGSSQNTFIAVRSIIIPPGVNILATVQNSQNNTPVIISPLWREILP